jgi:hypothetical protein
VFATALRAALVVGFLIDAGLALLALFAQPLIAPLLDVPVKDPALTTIFGGTLLVLACLYVLVLRDTERWRWRSCKATWSQPLRRSDRCRSRRSWSGSTSPARCANEAAGSPGATPARRFAGRSALPRPRMKHVARRSAMRKSVIRQAPTQERRPPEGGWLDIERFARVEVTSEDPGFPVESAFVPDDGGRGWRAADGSAQIVRLVFDEPRPIRRIVLEFAEPDIERTQEFTLRWARRDGPPTEIVRQQWNFSPEGSTHEIEDYQVDLSEVSVLELTLKPDLTHERAVASLERWRVA